MGRMIYILGLYGKKPMLSFFNFRKNKGIDAPSVLLAEKDSFVVIDADGEATFPAESGFPKTLSSSCVVILGPSSCHVQFCEPSDSGTDEEREGALRWQIVDAPFSPENAVLVGVPLPGPDEGGLAQKRWMTYSCEKEFLANLEYNSKKQGRTISAVYAWPMITEALRKKIWGDSGSTDAVLVLGEKSSLLTISRGASVVFEKTFSWGSVDMASTEDALGVSGRDRAELDLQRTLDYFDRRVSTTPASRILVAADKGARGSVESFFEGFSHFTEKRFYNVKESEALSALLREFATSISNPALNLWTKKPKREVSFTTKAFVAGLVLALLAALSFAIERVVDNKTKEWLAIKTKAESEKKAWTERTEALTAARLKESEKLAAMTQEEELLKNSLESTKKVMEGASSLIPEVMDKLNSFESKGAWLSMFETNFFSGATTAIGGGSSAEAGAKAVERLAEMSLGVSFTDGTVSVSETGDVIFEARTIERKTSEEGKDGEAK